MRYTKINSTKQPIGPCLAPLVTLFWIRTMVYYNRYRYLPESIESCRVLPSPVESCRVLPSSAESRRTSGTAGEARGDRWARSARSLLRSVKDPFGSEGSDRPHTPLGTWTWGDLGLISHSRSLNVSSAFTASRE